MTGARNRGSEALVQSLVVGLSGLAPPLSLSVSLHTEDTNYDRDQFEERLDKIVPYSKWPPRQLLRALLEMLAKQSRSELADSAKRPIKGFSPLARYP